MLFQELQYVKCNIFTMMIKMVFRTEAQGLRSMLLTWVGRHNMTLSV